MWDREEPLPDLLTQAANAVQAAVAHAAAGFPRASEEEVARRKALCLACEHYRPSDDRCSRCGCHLSVKMAWEEQKCPVGKW